MAVRLPSIFSRNKPQTQAGGAGATPPIKPLTAVGGAGDWRRGPSGALPPPPPSVTGKPLVPNNGQPLGFASNGLDRRMKVDTQGRVSSDFAYQDSQRKINRSFGDDQMKRIDAIKDPKAKQQALVDNAAHQRRLEAGTRTPAPPRVGAVTDSAGNAHNPSLFTNKAAGLAKMGSLRPPSANDNKPIPPAPKPQPSNRPAPPPPPRTESAPAAKKKGRRGKG